MQKIIIITYAELNTKKENIGFFLKCLKKNISYSLKDIDIKYDKGRMFIKSDEDNFNEIKKQLSNVFGIHEFFIGYELNTNDIDEIKKQTNKLLNDKKFNSFKVSTKRSFKEYNLKSPEINHIMGATILKSFKTKKVDVHNPDITIYIEIRSNNSLIYFEKIKGLGGYPVSSLGKGLLMLSGGIDSPVAGFLAMKRGIKIEAVYFDSPPHTSDKAKEKVYDLAKKLATYNNDLKIHIIKLTSIQEAIYKSIPNEYLITILRRMMYRISEKLAYKNNCKILINGESIGQVASQTLTSMQVINDVVSIPVIRPVACFDKLEIIDIAKKINTYDISIRPYLDCCTVFVPKHPVINPTKELCLEYERLIPYEELINQAILNQEIIKVSEFNNTYNDLL